MGGDSFNPLFIILKENKLIGPNYINQKRNLNLVLIAEEYKFVLTNVCPPLQIATLRKRKSRSISIGRKQMRWQGVIFWPPCPIYYNTSMRTWPLLMT